MRALIAGSFVDEVNGRLTGRARQIDFNTFLWYYFSALSKPMSGPNNNLDAPPPQEGLPPVVTPEDGDAFYSNFHIDPDKLAAFATNPEGPIGLSIEDLSRVPVAFDAKPRVFTYGSTRDPSVALIGPRLNIRDGLAPDAIPVKVGIRTARKVLSPEKIESTLVHELRHVKQVAHREKSLKRGKTLMMSAYLTGAYGIPAAMEAINGGKSLSLGDLAIGGLCGALGGLSVGYKLAPHEREARKAAKETPYQGIVTGTPSPRSKPRWFSRIRRT